MHALSHSLSHRAPPPRPRLRWQPYGARSPMPMNTPLSSSSSSPASTASIFDLDLPKLTHAHPSKDSFPRDPQRNKYILALVDQAVRTLCDIWPLQNIPSIFLVTAQPSLSVVLAAESLSNMVIQPSPQFSHHTQLPSPITPSMSRSPPSPPSAPSTSTSSSSDSLSYRSNLVPIRGFVHEVLRRSRSSGTVLQTALCYLEAIRSKIPDLVRREQAGQGVRGEPDLTDRIAQGEPGSDSLRDPENPPDRIVGSDSDPPMDCLPPSDTTALTSLLPPDVKTAPANAAHQDPSKRPRPPSAPLPPLPPLPSPLLCPRRAFLASLILASKFTQDKCYSNRAWAKLSGLPPREIGRCERALGDALEWRLWVGKMPSSAASASSAPVSGTHSNIRTVVRSHSDSDLLAGSKSGIARKWRHQRPSLGMFCLDAATMTNRNGLLRSATLPASAFAGQKPSPAAPPQIAMHVSATIDPQTGMIATSDPPLALHPGVNVTASRTTYSDSPSDMATPTLTHSPSSTESSSGDRTIQMTSFFDELSGTFGSTNKCFAAMPHALADPTQKQVSPPFLTGEQPNGAYAATNPAFGFDFEKRFVASSVPAMTSDFGSHVFATE